LAEAAGARSPEPPPHDTSKTLCYKVSLLQAVNDAFAHIPSGGVASMKRKNVCLLVFTCTVGMLFTELPYFGVAQTMGSPSDGVKATAVVIPVDPRNCQLQLTSAQNGVRFDIDGNGAEEQISWIAPNSGLGFLALDRNGNGKIDNGKELYGRQTFSGKGDGFAALHADAASTTLGVGHRVGFIEPGNPLFDKLLIWTDQNQNGLSEPYELQPVKELYASLSGSYAEADPQSKNAKVFYLEGNATVRTAPGRNRPKTRAEDLERLVTTYDVILQGQ
jgi:hypothetical protein